MEPLGQESNQIREDEPTLPLGTFHLCSHFLLPSPGVSSLWADLAMPALLSLQKWRLSVPLHCPALLSRSSSARSAPSPGLPNCVPAETKLPLKAASRGCPAQVCGPWGCRTISDGFRGALLCHPRPACRSSPAPPAISSLLKNIQRGSIKANIVLLLPGVTLDENYMKQ